MHMVSYTIRICFLITAIVCTLRGIAGYTVDCLLVHVMVLADVVWISPHAPVDGLDQGKCDL